MERYAKVWRILKCGDRRSRPKLGLAETRWVLGETGWGGERQSAWFVKNSAAENGGRRAMVGKPLFNEET